MKRVPLLNILICAHVYTSLELSILFRNVFNLFSDDLMAWSMCFLLPEITAIFRKTYLDCHLDCHLCKSAINSYLAIVATEPLITYRNLHRSANRYSQNHINHERHGFANLLPQKKNSAQSNRDGQLSAFRAADPLLHSTWSSEIVSCLCPDK